MYKWPQGRVIRIVCLILAAVIVADLIYHGAYGRFEAYRTAIDAGAGTRQLVLASFFAVLALVTAIAALVAVGFHAKAVNFLIEVEQEMAKVEWPKVDTLWKSTLVIALTIIVMAGVIFAIDWGILVLFRQSLKLGEYL
jgi:preprotein translocase SecE subunit